MLTGRCRPRGFLKLPPRRASETKAECHSDACRLGGEAQASPNWQPRPEGARCPRPRCSRAELGPAHSLLPFTGVAGHWRSQSCLRPASRPLAARELKDLPPRRATAILLPPGKGKGRRSKQRMWSCGRRNKWLRCALFGNQQPNGHSRQSQGPPELKQNAPNWARRSLTKVSRQARARSCDVSRSLGGRLESNGPRQGAKLP